MTCWPAYTCQQTLAALQTQLLFTDSLGHSFPPPPLRHRQAQIVRDGNFSLQSWLLCKHFHFLKQHISGPLRHHFVYHILLASLPNTCIALFWL